MRSAQLAAALCGSLLVLASCGRDSDPTETAMPATADAASVKRGCYSAESMGPVIGDWPWNTSLGLNSRGMVVGTTPRWSTDLDPRRAFLFRRGTESPLGDLGGGVSEARAVNEWGFAVGGSLDSDSHWRAASFFRGAVTDLGSLDGTHSWAVDVNNAGFAVGGGYVTDAASNVAVAHAAAFFFGKAFDLGILEGDTYANGVNDLFEVVGTGRLADGTWSGFVLRKGKLVQLATLGVPVPNDAQKINNRGTVCGFRSDPVGSFNKAFLVYRDGSWVDLPAPGYPYTLCLDVSDDGVAVGIADDGMTGWRAVVWPDPSEPPVDLNSRVVPAFSDVGLGWASRISSNGMITVYGFSFSTYEYMGYLLRPTACRK